MRSAWKSKLIARRIALLLDFFNLSEPDAYKLDGPLSMTHLTPLVANDAFAKLKGIDRARSSPRPWWISLKCCGVRNVPLHHPYDSYDQIVELAEAAAKDPQVLAIKITLYRTSGDLPIVEALIDAANAGKQKPRRSSSCEPVSTRPATFSGHGDWSSRRARRSMGVVGLKTHCKALLDRSARRRRTQALHPSRHLRARRAFTPTSACYQLTELSGEVATVFNTLTGLAGYPGLKHVAPFADHSG